MSEQILRGLRQALRAGAYAPGDRLPAAPALAAGLAVNPVAVRAAYQALMDEGLLEYQTSGGPRVTGKALEPDRREKLLRDWDQTTGELLILGCTRKELQSRLKEVGA